MKEANIPQQTHCGGAWLHSLHVPAPEKLHKQYTFLAPSLASKSLLGKLTTMFRQRICECVLLEAQTTKKLRTMTW